jgi:hypothetical protein
MLGVKVQAPEVVVGVFIAPFASAGVIGVIDWTNEKWRWLDALKQWLNE